MGTSYQTCDQKREGGGGATSSDEFALFTGREKRKSVRKQIWRKKKKEKAIVSQEKRSNPFYFLSYTEGNTQSHTSLVDFNEGQGRKERAAEQNNPRKGKKSGTYGDPSP